MAAQPEGSTITFISAFGYHVKVVIVDVQHVVSAEVTRVGVKNSAALIFVEHTVSLTLRTVWILFCVVVKGLFLNYSHPSHPQAHGIDFSVMKLEEFLERRQIVSRPS